MTRDEAIADFAAAIWPETTSGPDLAVRYIDWFAKHGMLKLDEPKAPVAKLAIALGWPENGRSHDELLHALVATDLRIVAANSDER